MGAAMSTLRREREEERLAWVNVDKLAAEIFARNVGSLVDRSIELGQLLAPGAPVPEDPLALVDRELEALAFRSLRAARAFLRQARIQYKPGEPFRSVVGDEP